MATNTAHRTAALHATTTVSAVCLSAGLVALLTPGLDLPPVLFTVAMVLLWASQYAVERLIRHFTQV